MVLGVAALVALLIPASAFAGTYSWALPGDFSGHNPETKYGVPSWSYDGTTGAPMTSFSNNTWSDGIGDSIGANNSGFMTMGAAGGNSAQIAWSNPFTASQAVTVTNTMSPSCPVSLGGGLNPNPSGTMTVTPGQTLAFKLNGGLLGCSATGTISISASVPAPAVSVTSPTSGATVGAFQQTFAGTASSGFGISNQVTVRLYSGSSATGTPLETLTATQSGGSWSVPASAILVNGTYTVQAEQDDLAGDQGLSSPVTFTVSHPPPAVSVTSPKSGATVTNAQPSFAGAAGSGFGISDTVTVRLYSGASASGTPVETLTTTQSGGAWSVSASSMLDNGTYTVQAEQDDTAGDQGFSTPVTFTEDHMPVVSVTSPSFGATITDPQPAFSGGASSGLGISDTVTVRLYSGASATGTPIETLTTTQQNDSWAVFASSILANGQYTVQAEQDDTIGDQGFSAPVTFTVAVPPPTVSLNSLGNAPLQVVAPTLTGTGSTRSVDDGQVTVDVYSGTDTSAPAVRTLSASVGSGGSFSVKVQPALSDGQYTAVATQGSSVGLGSSRAVVFRVKVTPPALTLDQPGSGVTLNVTKPTFSGQAGTALGDSPNVTVYVYKGSSASGNPMGSDQVSANGSNWSTKWPHKLSYGSYTVVAAQSDDAGHTSRTAPNTFTVAPTPKLIGSTATLSRSGGASVQIGCVAAPGQTCTGTVLIVTRRAYRASAGGPAGALEVLYASVRVPAGQALVIHRPVSGSVLRVLRRSRRVPVVVTVNLSRPSGGRLKGRANRVLKIQR
jgi:major membrane immunogen (membrane-anchored lipoprotein)